MPIISGLVLNSYGDLVIMDQMPRQSVAVLIYSQDGTLVKRSSYQPHDPHAWTGSKCRFLHCYGKDDLYMVDLGQFFHLLQFSTVYSNFKFKLKTVY